MLLDTCALLWLSHDQTRMSEKTLGKIDAAPVAPSQVGWAPRADDFSVLNLPSSPE